MKKIVTTILLLVATVFILVACNEGTSANTSSDLATETSSTTSQTTTAQIDAKTAYNQKGFLLLSRKRAIKFYATDLTFNMLVELGWNEKGVVGYKDGKFYLLREYTNKEDVFTSGTSKDYDTDYDIGGTLIVVREEADVPYTFYCSNDLCISGFGVKIAADGDAEVLDVADASGELSESVGKQIDAFLAKEIKEFVEGVIFSIKSFIGESLDGATTIRGGYLNTCGLAVIKNPSSSTNVFIDGECEGLNLIEHDLFGSIVIDFDCATRKYTYQATSVNVDNINDIEIDANGNVTVKEAKMPDGFDYDTIMGIISEQKGKAAKASANSLIALCKSRVAEEVTVPRTAIGVKDGSYKYIKTNYTDAQRIFEEGTREPLDMDNLVVNGSLIITFDATTGAYTYTASSDFAVNGYKITISTTGAAILGEYVG